MSIESHLAELVRKHRELDGQIAEEQRAPGSDDLSVQAMKKWRLRLKEEIEKIRQRAA